ncbi:MAG TPA: glucosamine-6-phosphate deaminase [Marinobacter sp.]|nr:glucosamine-6-phosphate deaminase [Marinobacter sp.]
MYKIFNTANEASFYTAQRLVNKIQAKPEAALGLATGSTMEPVYAHFLQLLESAPVDVTQITTFNLDEYIGLGADHAQSYSYYMNQHLFTKLSLSKDRVNLPNGTLGNVESACKAYSEAIHAAGRLDLQLLGVGTNGHIGFNEPFTCFSSRTHVIELSEQTRLDNGRFFTDLNEMPTQAITMGILDILEAKEIVLVATGHKKAAIMAELFHGDVNEALPASALKRHQNVTFVLDREAAALLPDEVRLFEGLKAC